MLYWTYKEIKKSGIGSGSKTPFLVIFPPKYQLLEVLAPRIGLTPVLQSSHQYEETQPIGEDAYSPPTTSYCLPFWLGTVFDLVYELTSSINTPCVQTYPFRKDGFLLLGDEVRNTTVSFAHDCDILVSSRWDVLHPEVI